MSDFRDLTSWNNDTKAVISQDELAKDVNGAEALLERHAEHKSEIDAREDSFRATAEAGQMLLDSGHYASEEVTEKLALLTDEKTALLVRNIMPEKNRFKTFDDECTISRDCMTLRYIP